MTSEIILRGRVDGECVGKHLNIYELLLSVIRRYFMYFERPPGASGRGFSSSSGSLSSFFCLDCSMGAEFMSPVSL